MPSSSKSKKLALNQFVGTDKPKMEDFNYDNQQLERLVGGHLEDGVAHLTAAQREEIASQKIIIGSYMGDDALSRDIDLGFAPTMGIIFAVGEAPGDISQNGYFQNYIYSGYFTKLGCTAGLSLAGTVLTVKNLPPYNMNHYFHNFNMAGSEYVYCFFR